MISIGNTLISDDLLEIRFICPLEKCHGACCVDGDAGAPLEVSEISELEDYIDDIKAFMTERGVKVIEEMGVFDYDAMANFVTPLVNGVECAFTNFEKGIAYCAIERAYEEGAIPIRKPVSCHLYPVRITQLEGVEAVNYHKWPICKPALKNGKNLGVPLYKFLKEPLIRKYGSDWYNELEKIASGS